MKKVKFTIHNQAAKTVDVFSDGELHNFSCYIDVYNLKKEDFPLYISELDITITDIWDDPPADQA